ncbi:MAG: ribulose-phosphate 3-epimerase [Bacteroidales bacterium]|nr:ribulose-phosphate 3-epimerase [Clostridium sp.]MCM1202671.1 ribulose-phosphate 3-epimerase [Bacteroidales bacterium]
MNYLSPSVLSADFSVLGKEIEKAAGAGAEMIHLDVMDGRFVPNLSFGAPVISCVRKVTDAVFDVHLMIEEPIRYIKEFRQAGADIISVHYEACKEVKETLSRVHELGAKAGLAISPDTPVSALAPYIEQLDMILIMSVYPGFGGQKFIPESVEKIREARRMVREAGKGGLLIEVDGGIGEANIEAVRDAGANVFVAGSAVFKGDTEENVKRLKALLN